MKITKTILQDQIPGLYAVGDIKLDGRLFYGAASENPNGSLYLVNAETKESSLISGGVGGVMAVIDAVGENAMLCIEEFYPVFKSATAKIVKIKLEQCKTGYQTANRTVIANVPYVHRIAQLKEQDGLYLAAGKLCKSKTEPEDWSTSGTMEMGTYNPNEEHAHMKQIWDGINKHHAMFVKQNAQGFDDLYFGGSEGVFYSSYLDGAWITKQIIDVPTSDVIVWDLDEDGKEEVVIIDGFHGNKAVVFKDMGKGYERVLEYELDFGHVLWGGDFLGKPALITGSRGGKKELLLYRFHAASNGQMELSEKILIDSGQAPAQIIVHEHGEYADIVAANHGAQQLVRYDCTP